MAISFIKILPVISGGTEFFWRVAIPRPQWRSSFATSPNFFRGTGRVAEMKMLDKTEQSDRAPNANEKPENCYCSALPKGSGLCLPCYTRWLADERPRPGN